jgi:hypothetical protein
VTLSVLASFAFAEHLRPLPDGSHLMLDSGGYSAWSKGIEVTVEGLTGWYLDHPEAEVYAGLDVIYNPQATRANALAQRALGADVTPAVHAGTPPAEVDRLAADGFTKLALGGLVNKRNSSVGAEAWAHACLDRAHHHGMTVHGFGLSPSSPARLPLLLRFTSVDSSTWLAARYGRDTRIWDGRAYRSYDMNRDRMTLAQIFRRWPPAAGHDPWTSALTRQHGQPGDPDHLRMMNAAGAASMLAWGQWLMARGGPRVYLASYAQHVKPAWDAVVADLFAAITPVEARR